MFHLVVELAGANPRGRLLKCRSQLELTRDFREIKSKLYPFIIVENEYYDFKIKSEFVDL